MELLMTSSSMLRYVRIQHHAINCSVQAINRKYIEPEAELSVFLPSDIRQDLLDDKPRATDQGSGQSMSVLRLTPPLDIYDAAQTYVYDCLNQRVVPTFWESIPGKKFRELSVWPCCLHTDPVPGQPLSLWSRMSTQRTQKTLSSMLT